MTWEKRALSDILINEQEIPDYYTLLGLNPDECPKWPVDMEIDGEKVDMLQNGKQHDHRLFYNFVGADKAVSFRDQVDRAKDERFAEAAKLGLGNNHYRYKKLEEFIALLDPQQQEEICTAINTVTGDDTPERLTAARLKHNRGSIPWFIAAAVEKKYEGVEDKLSTFFADLKQLLPGSNPLTNRREPGLTDVLHNLLYSEAALALRSPSSKIRYDAGLTPEGYIQGNDEPFTRSADSMHYWKVARQVMLQRELGRDELPHQKVDDWGSYITGRATNKSTDVPPRS